MTSIRRFFLCFYALSLSSCGKYNGILNDSSVKNGNVSQPRYVIIKGLLGNSAVQYRHSLSYVDFFNYAFKIYRQNGNVSFARCRLSSDHSVNFFGNSNIEIIGYGNNKTPTGDNCPVGVVVENI